MKLVERYIYAVIRCLPRDQREDVAKELRGMIEDALDERGSRSQKTVEAVLLSLGDPEVFAQKYMADAQYVVGPSLYPSFLRTLKISLLWGVPVAFVIQFVAQMTQEPAGLVELIGAALGMTVSIAIYIFFFVTLFFFILERTGVKGEEMTRYAHGKSWDPSMLPELPTPREIPLGEVIAEAVWYGFVTLLPFFATRFIGAREDSQFIPFFNPEIWSTGMYIVMAFGVVGLAQALIKFLVRNWSRALAVFSAVYALAVSVFLVVAFASVTIVNPQFLSFLDEHIDNTTLTQVTNVTNWTVALAVGMTALTYLYEAGKRLVATFRR